MHFLLRLERAAGVERAEASAEAPNNNKEHRPPGVPLAATSKPKSYQECPSQMYWRIGLEVNTLRVFPQRHSQEVRTAWNEGQLR